MGWLGGNIVLADERTGISSTGTPTADGDFEGGYCIEADFSAVSSLGPCGAFNSAYTLATGDSIYFWFQMKVTSAEAIGAVTTVCTMDNSSASIGVMDTSVTNVRVRIGATQQLSVSVRDGNGNITGTTFAGALTDDVRYTVTAKVTKVSSTQITVELFQDGTSKGTHTHNAAGGVGTLTYTNVRTGCDLNAKTTGVIRHGGPRACDSTGSVPNSLTGEGGLDNISWEVILPNGDVGGEADWTKSGGGAGTYTTWDDALGSYDDTDYNESGTGAGVKTQASEFASVASMTSTQSAVLSLYVANVTPSSVNHLLVTDDGTEDAQAPSVVYVQTSGFATCAQRHFPTKGGGGVWTQSAINGANFKCRRPDTGVNWNVDAFWAVVWYWTPTAVAEERQPALMGMSGGII